MPEAAVHLGQVRAMPAQAPGPKEEGEQCSRPRHLQEAARAGGAKGVTCGDSQRKHGAVIKEGETGGLRVKEVNIINSILFVHSYCVRV